jgi:hypothetical protein
MTIPKQESVKRMVFIKALENMHGWKSLRRMSLKRGLRVTEKLSHSGEEMASFRI